MSDEIKIPDSIIQKSPIKENEKTDTPIELNLEDEMNVGEYQKRLYKKYSNMDFEKFALKANFNEYDYHSDSDTSSGE